MQCVYEPRNNLNASDNNHNNDDIRNIGKQQHKKSTQQKIIIISGPFSLRCRESGRVQDGVGSTLEIQMYNTMMDDETQIMEQLYKDKKIRMGR